MVIQARLIIDLTPSNGNLGMSVIIIDLANPIKNTDMYASHIIDLKPSSPLMVV
jgi:hypothetical protein